MMKNITLLLSTLVLVILAAGCTSGPELTGVTWRWTSLEENEPSGISVVPNPENYTLTFEADGALSLKLDCNMGGGTYQLDGTGLTIELGMTTLAFCGEESLDTQFTSLLAQVDGYALEEGSLILRYGAGAGRMVFNP